MIRIYVADCSVLSDTAIFNTIYDRIPMWRRQRTGKIKNHRNACQSLGAGYLFTLALRDVGRDDLLENVIFLENGKPDFGENTGLHFGLSHSRDMAVCVVADSPVGCDIQDMSRQRKGIADRFFAEPERKYIDSAETEEEINRRFFEIWTDKEAYTKLSGEGIARDFRSFCVFDAEGNFWKKQIGTYCLSVYTDNPDDDVCMINCRIEDDI